jgi:hypothetical protein
MEAFSGASGFVLQYLCASIGVLASLKDRDAVARTRFLPN